MSIHSHISEITLSALTCEYAANPLSIDVPAPRLSWQLSSPQRGQCQTAYHLLVASEAALLEADSGDLWDTGKVETDQSVHIVYAGVPLASRQRCYWKVRVWDKDGVPGAWSETAWWEMGLLQPEDWRAAWIGAGWEVDPNSSTPCPFLRTGFSAGEDIVSARLYVSALGLYEVWLNGRRVGEDYFTPGWTDYQQRVQYQSYDVTDLLHTGDNALGVILADGWFSGYLLWENNRNVFGCPTRLLAQLEITYTDGRVETLASDDGWKTATGPLLSADIYHGETYDARQELAGWSEAGFDDAAWLPARIHAPTEATLNASASPRVRKIREIAPLGISQPVPGAFIFDLGQNMTGWARLNLPATTPAGTAITLRFAEVLNPDGTLYTTNLRSAKCTDQFISAGGAAQYEPRFTFHGFRYVEVSGFPGEPSLDTITGIVLHSDTPSTGSFTCSHPMLNQLQHNIEWGQRSNFLEVPTDCPQRDERLGWTGDAQVFIHTAAFNMHVAGFFTKWMADLCDAQSLSGAFPMVAPDVLGKKEGDGGAGWADAAIICPWTVYRCYGDTRLLDTYYPAMVRYLDYLGAVNQRTRHCFGDWLNHNDPTPADLIGHAFYAYDARLMAEIATALGKEADAAAYHDLFARLKAAFIAEYVTPHGRLVGDSQTAYVLALHFDLLPDALRPAAAGYLAQRIHERTDHLSTGFLGTPYLLAALAENGHLDLAYKLLLNEDFPSWGYPIKHGATTMWERWDGWRHDAGFQDPGMNSFNHYAYGAVGDWMYQNIAGLDLAPQQTGYQHSIIRPRPGGGVTGAGATLHSVYGQIAVAWQLADGQFTLDATVPPNTTATVYLPTTAVEAITEGKLPAMNAEGVTFIGAEEGSSVFTVVAGTYRFTMPSA